MVVLLKTPSHGSIFQESFVNSSFPSSRRDHRSGDTNRTGYAWSRETDNGKRFVAILKMPPVDSPSMAVCAAITDESKGNHRKAKPKNP